MSGRFGECECEVWVCVNGSLGNMNVSLHFSFVHREGV